MLASGRAQDADSGALPLNADAAVLAGTLRAGEKATVRLAPGRGAYLVAGNRCGDREWDTGRHA